MATAPSADFDNSGCGIRCGSGGEEQSSSSRRRKSKGGGRRKIEESQHMDDAALAKELNELSKEERERILEEIHGVADDTAETPELIASCLEEMNARLASLSSAKRRDFDRAVFLKPSIADDKKFKLMFLRSEYFNAKKAAERMTRYFACKRDLFDDDKLVKKITLDDLDENDTKAGKALFRVAKTDSAGRPVCVIDATELHDHDHRNVNRFRFYSAMIMLESETAQKKGAVLIVYSPGGSDEESTEEVSTTKRNNKLPTPSQVINFFRESKTLKTSLPVRMTSCHYCSDNPFTNFFIELIRASAGRDLRLRLRTHFGSATEMRYALRSFGINMDGIITSERREDKRTKLWYQLIESRSRLEKKREQAIAAEQKRTGIVVFATKNDVLLGSGRSYQEFSGNRSFRALLNAQADRYKSCEHLFEKVIVLKESLKEIHDSGGQFLKRVNNGWEIVDDEVAKEKMRKYFRSIPGGGGMVPATPASSTPPATTSSNYDGVVAASGAGSNAKRLKVDPKVESEKG